MVDGTTTVYRMAGSLIVSEKTGSDTIWYHYDSNANVIGAYINNVRYYYLRNAQNDVIGLIDGSGNLVVQYKYDSWGNIISITGSLASTVGQKNPFRYRGYYYDVETGLYYLQSRYYDPELRRFINSDSRFSKVGSGVRAFNMFSYCFNNPVNMVDPSGKMPELFRKISVALTVAGKIITLPFKTIEFSISFGVGFGGTASANIYGANFSLDLLAANKESLILKRGKPDIVTSSSANIGISAFEGIGFSGSVGKQHSYNAEECECGFHDVYKDKIACPASQSILESNPTIGVGVGGYIGIGGEVYIGIDVETLAEEWDAIVEYSVANY